jgi:NTP pyrophosphatase (non-canonical NTP hydrolase)
MINKSGADKPNSRFTYNNIKAHGVNGAYYEIKYTTDEGEVWDSIPMDEVVSIETKVNVSELNNATTGRLDLVRFQNEVGVWSDRNFPNSTPTLTVLGLIEELGELSHAVLKSQMGSREPDIDYKAKMRDAVGDITIFLADFCKRSRISLESCIIDAWAEVGKREFTQDRGPVNSGGPWDPPQ